MSKQQHPDAEELARYQAGEIGGPRGRQLAAHIADCAHCASVSDDLAAVSRVLASVPAPSMPDAVESRITAALAAEAATRQAASPAADGAAGAAAAARCGRESCRESCRERRAFPRPSPGPLGRIETARQGLPPGHGGCLGRGVPGAGGLRVPAEPDGEQFEFCPGERGRSRGLARGGDGERPCGCRLRCPSRCSRRSPSASALRPLEGQQAIPFLVTKSSTDYEQATLGTQVRDQLNQASKPAGAGRQSSSASRGLPSTSLIGCVERVTENVLPKLVDQATYDGKAAYVIAVSDHAWVVGPGCTASNPDVIASVVLPR